MSNVISLDRPASDRTAPAGPEYGPGDVVLVSDGGRQYRARVVARTWDGAYIVDPITAAADASGAIERRAA